MKKRFSLAKFNMRKQYIFTRPNRPFDVTEVDEQDEHPSLSDYKWLEKSRRMQARRWRKITHKLA